MQLDLPRCRHQLKRGPEVVTDVAGTSFLLFECQLCGCGIILRLNSEGEVDGEFVNPPEQKCA
jgi:hypothetical protein